MMKCRVYLSCCCCSRTIYPTLPFSPQTSVAEIVKTMTSSLVWEVVDHLRLQGSTTFSSSQPTDSSSKLTDTTGATTSASDEFTDTVEFIKNKSGEEVVADSQSSEVLVNAATRKMPLSPSDVWCVSSNINTKSLPRFCVSC